MMEEDQELRIKAESGDPEAQFRYAQALQYGLGIPMDDDASLKWFHAAAQQGLDRARFSLGEIYKEGRIVPQDLVQAYNLYKAVAEGGGELAAAGQEGCSEIRPYLNVDQSAEVDKA